MNRISLPGPPREESAAMAADGHPYETSGVLVGACAGGILSILPAVAGGAI